VTSPFIKFKNASKETIDGSEELVEEIRRALMQAGQKLSRHIRREDRANDLERKLQHIEKFAPILVEGLARIIKAPQSRKLKAEEGLKTLLGRDTEAAEEKLQDAESKLQVLKAKQKGYSESGDDDDDGDSETRAEAESESDIDTDSATAANETPARGTAKKSRKKK